MTSAARAGNAISEIAASATQLRKIDIEMLRGGRCARRWRSRRRGRTEIEINRRRFLRALLCFEERPRRKTKHSRNQVGWKSADCNVVHLHRGVEFVSFDRDPVLRSLKLRLQAAEIFGRSELRIIFGDHQ